MDRQIVYSGAIPLETDQLQQNQNAMVGLGYALQALLGTGTLVDGLACTPTTPASMSVKVAEGSIYSQQNLEATAYGSLSADTTHQIVKQGIALDSQTFACPAPGTSGHSIVYLIEAAYQDVDAGPTVLPYYNASNPSQAYAGPANSGISQNTVRKGVCKIQVKAGVSATTGSQTTPAPTAGFTGLYAITVANGQSTITSGNIAQLATAPFIGTKITGKLGTITRTIITASGTYTPPSGLICAHVEAQGAGAGGGAVPTTSGTQGTAGAGGGAGGYASKWFTNSQIGASQAVTVGAAGAGGVAGANSGTNGGNTAFGSLLSANGGIGGGTTGAQSQLAGSSTPGAGGTASGGDINVSGGSGNFGIAFGGYTFGIGGAGGNSRLGIGGAGGLTAAGTNGSGYGSGGGGAGSGNTYVANAGGNGAPGVIIVTEYCK